MYLVVFNLKEDEVTNRIEYWLQSIKSKAPRAPVVLVGTHADELTHEQVRSLAHFPLVTRIMACSCPSACTLCAQNDLQAVNYFERLGEKYGNRFPQVKLSAAVSTLTFQVRQKFASTINQHLQRICMFCRTCFDHPCFRASSS
jgi:hypothetical protein